MSKLGHKNKGAKFRVIKKGDVYYVQRRYLLFFWETLTQYTNFTPLYPKDDPQYQILGIQHGYPREFHNMYNAIRKAVSLKTRDCGKDRVNDGVVWKC